MSKIYLSALQEIGATNDPHKTMKEIFANFHPTEIKQGLWEWYKIALWTALIRSPGSMGFKK